MPPRPFRADVGAAVAPAELPFLALAIEAYLGRGPAGRGGRGADDLLGFGPTEIAGLFSPIVIAVVVSVVQPASDEAGRKLARRGAAWWESVRRPRKSSRAAKHDKAPAAVRRLSPQDLIDVAHLARRRADLFLVFIYSVAAVYIPLLGTLGVLAGAWLRRQTQRHQAVGTAPVAGRIRPTIGIAVAVFMIAASGLSVWSSSIMSKPDQAPNAAETDSTPWPTAAITPDSPVEAAYLVASWLRLGGQDQITGLTNALDTYSISKADDDCTALQAALDDAMSFPRIPDDTAQQEWYAIISAAQQASDYCAGWDVPDAVASAQSAAAMGITLELDLANAMHVS